MPPIPDSLSLPSPPISRLSIAVVGTGIAGLSAAWLLAQRHDVTLFEKESRLGGHSNTVEAPLPEGGTIAVDTGFIVYNAPNYPNLVALFDHLGVTTRDTDMSFAVSADGGGLEYSGSGLGGVLAQPSNALRPRFWSMMRDLVRFYRTAAKSLKDPEITALSLGDFLRRERYGKPFIEDHLLPMGAAIWSAPPAEMEAYPAAAFIEFFRNHALLDLGNRPPWRTVVGGSREYVMRLRAAFAVPPKLGLGVRRIKRDPSGVIVQDGSGKNHGFDHVVIATHADEALGLLADPSGEERRLLGAFKYQANDTWLHRDSDLMPRRRRAWAAWNFLLDRREGRNVPPTVTYWMNRLQHLETTHNLFVTLNPPRPPREDLVLERFRYDHPLFNGLAMRAQKELWRLQGQGNTWFCGSYFGAGFHEDALQSGLLCAERLGGVRRPWRVGNESARIAPWPNDVKGPGGVGMNAMAAQ
ncbi:NAD(P)/FAD-dependent oxidoreductase [Rhodospirillum sp. A1_3_36]|uniref:NAD(P)/FAD-dependent oxidoreductase n=1 Tax=Rhodospirillum sp. A1_3_36 TaxID=3391666 RepID=UPI0039A4D890